MKRSLPLLAFLLLAFVSLPLFAVQRSVVDDVIRMTKAGVAEETILDFVKKAEARYDVTADDMIAMSDAKVSRIVMKAVLDQADSTNGRSTPHDALADGRGDRVVRETVVVGGVPYGYYSRYAPWPYWYDPFWYGPGLSIGFSFGPYYRYGSYYGYRGGYYGGYHGGYTGGYHGGYRGNPGHGGGWNRGGGPRGGRH
jgi:hypothetical protein